MGTAWGRKGMSRGASPGSEASAMRRQSIGDAPPLANPHTPAPRLSPPLSPQRCPPDMRRPNASNAWTHGDLDNFPIERWLVIL
eukprot:9472127-Pyramimonas_sp.AAC.1